MTLLWLLKLMSPFPCVSLTNVSPLAVFCSLGHLNDSSEFFLSSFLVSVHFASQWELIQISNHFNRKRNNYLLRWWIYGLNYGESWEKSYPFLAIIYIIYVLHMLYVYHIYNVCVYIHIQYIMHICSVYILYVYAYMHTHISQRPEMSSLRLQSY